MNLLKLLKILLLLLSLEGGYAWGVFSHSEGALDRGHDQSLQVYRKQYFYDNQGRLDPRKLQRLKDFLSEQKRIVEDSARLNRKTKLIFAHGYENDRASKEGEEALNTEAENIAPFIFALENVEDLLSNYRHYPPQVIHEKVELTLLWIAAAYTLDPRGIFTSFIDRTKNLAENFFEFKKNDTNEVQASNLLYNGQFQTPSQLRALRRQGVDISKLDPPSSAIWMNNEVEKYDPENEIYWNHRLFPPRDVKLPVFYYERMGNGTIKFKTHWRDPQELNKKGEPKKKSVTLRLGWESYTASVVNHLARIIGYYANPTTFRHEVKLVLGETTLEEFLAQWKNIHELEMGSAMTHMERIPGENAVILKNVTLEAYPDDDEYRKISPFRMGDNGLRNRREYRAMVLYNGLISLQDQFEYQSRVDAYNDPELGTWRPLFFLSDTSSALGLPAMLGNKGTVNEYTWEFTRIYRDQVYIFWFSVFDPRTWQTATYSDVKWLARRMARISTAQIDAIMRTSGFPVPVRELYAEKIKSRLNKMMIDFDLVKEGFQLHPVKSPTDLSQAHPQYIDKDGYLKEKAQEIPGNTLPILGNRFTPYQAIVVKAINALQNRFLKLLSSETLTPDPFTIDIDHVPNSQVLVFGAERDVKVNPELGPGQKRYLLKDSFAISIPIGFNNEKFTTPLALYYTFTFSYFHSVSTMTEVGTKRFFGLMNPFSLSDIRQNLGLGEQLVITHGIGTSIGYVKWKVNDDFNGHLALMGTSKDLVKTLYFAKTSNDMLEITTDKISHLIFRNGFDIQAVTRAALMMTNYFKSSEYRLYRVDLLNKSESEKEILNQAFEEALVYNDFSKIDKHVHSLRIDEESRMQRFDIALFLWNMSLGHDIQELKINDDTIYVARETKSVDRAFKRLWNDKIDPGHYKFAADYVGNFWEEGELFDISFEGKANASLTDFEEMEVQIYLSKLDMYCTRKEFDRDFKPHFNSRSGQKKYIDFKMPQGIDVYPELFGQMRWQLSAKAIDSILRASFRWDHLEHMLDKTNPPDIVSPTDPREVVTYRAARALRAIPAKATLAERRKLMKEKAQDILFVIKSTIGQNGEYVGQLRKFVNEQDIWMITSIAHMLDRSHASFNTKKDQVFWAPEVGKFQGHSYMNRFRRQRLSKPVFIF